jgi:hypothetical protein
VPHLVLCSLQLLHDPIKAGPQRLRVPTAPGDASPTTTGAGICVVEHDQAAAVVSVTRRFGPGPARRLVTLGGAVLPDQMTRPPLRYREHPLQMGDGATPTGRAHQFPRPSSANAKRSKMSKRSTPARTICGSARPTPRPARTRPGNARSSRTPKRRTRGRTTHGNAKPSKTPKRKTPERTRCGRRRRVIARPKPTHGIGRSAITRRRNGSPRSGMIASRGVRTTPESGRPRPRTGRGDSASGAA